MTAKIKKTLTITTIITLLPIVVGVFYWNQLPEKIVTHFDSNWEPNGWSSKWFAVIGLPVFLAVVNAICTLATERDPRRGKYPEKMMKIVYWICPVVSWFCAASVYGYALGFELTNMGQYGSLLLGVVFVILGNYMPKVKQNYYLGIKLPWTYADEDNWNKTHRLAGKVWVIGGILFILNFFLQIKGIEVFLIFALILIPTIYSWAYSKRTKKE